MSFLAGMIGKVAAEKALPYVSKVLSERFGKGGEMAGLLVSKIADFAGVAPEELPDMAVSRPDAFAHAVEASEPEAADLYRMYVESQSLMNEAIEMDYRKRSWWAWAWRPTWMWILAVLWVYTLMVQPYVKTLWLPSLESVDPSLLMAVTGIFVTFYMGGHTAKQAIEKWKQRR